MLTYLNRIMVKQYDMSDSGVGKGYPQGCDSAIDVTPN